MPFLAARQASLLRGEMLNCGSVRNPMMREVGSSSRSQQVHRETERGISLVFRGELPGRATSGNRRSYSEN